MARYLLKRLLLLVPTLLLVSLIAFLLQESVPGDPVARHLGAAASESPWGQTDRRAYEAAYARAVAETGADRPAFYLTWRPISEPDTLHRILPIPEREAFRAWCHRSGGPDAPSRWFQALDHAVSEIDRDEALSPASRELLLRVTENLRVQTDRPGVLAALSDWPDTLRVPLRTQTLAALPALQPGRGWRNWVPAIDLHGTDNRYHRWLVGLLRGEGARSRTDGRAVTEKIGEAAQWTLGMNAVAIMLAYLAGIPLGVWMAGRAGKPSERLASILLFSAYAIPGFWMGTLLLVFLTTPQYGLDLFPSLGTGDIPSDAGLWEAWTIRAGHLILPVFCLTYGSVAFITRQVRNAMLEELKKDYIRTAWAKRLSRRVVLWRHAFPNAVFPLITLFAQVQPSALAGSVAVEVIFSIPGMGRLTYASILAQDWPVVYGILFMAAALTLAGSLLADILYALADPRIRLAGRKI